MIDFNRKFKNFGPLEFLVISSLVYVIIMLIWTGSTRSAVVQKANDIKFNHKTVVEFINNEVSECSSNENGKTAWGENCNSVWTSSNIVKYILDNFELNNPYNSIYLDQDGIISIEWGAYGVPESFLIYNNKIIKKVIGPISQKSLFEIKDIIK